MSFKKIILSAAVFFIFILNAVAQEPPKNKQHFEPRSFITNNIEFMKKNLNLSEDQTKKITEIMFDSMKIIEEKQIDIERSMLDIREQLLKENPDLSKIKNAIEKKAIIFSEIEFISVKRDINIKLLLTKEQFIKWKDLQMNGSEKEFKDPFFMPDYNRKKPFEERIDNEKTKDKKSDKKKIDSL